MRAVAVAVFVVAGCAGSPAGPPVDALRHEVGPAGGGPVRIGFDRESWTTWGVPAAPATWPGVARRAAEAVAPGGTITWSGRVLAREGGESFVLEKLEADGSWRRATVSADGHVLERAHSIDLQDAPAPVRARLSGLAVVRVAFVEDDRPNGRYRAVVDGVGGPPNELEIDAAGTLLRRSTVHDAVLRIDVGGR